MASLTQAIQDNNINQHGGPEELAKNAVLATHTWKEDTLHTGYTSEWGDAVAWLTTQGITEQGADNLLDDAITQGWLREPTLGRLALNPNTKDEEE